MPELKPFLATRIVALPASLDEADWPSDSLLLRLAPDEVLLSPPVSVALSDPHAIVISEGSFAGAWLPAEQALDVLERLCEWELPAERPAFAQGAVADIPTKLWLEDERVLFIVPGPYASEFEERIA